MDTIQVVNLATGQSQLFTCSPREAVIAAYAQERGDWNTWEYPEKYGAMVRESENQGRRYLNVGDQTVRLPDLCAEA